MNETIISWTNATWNPTHGCSKVSDGCRFCYAETLSRKYRQTNLAWTIPHEDENVTMKPHKLDEPYKLKEPSRCFVNSMSDMFHRAIPDWYRAVVFCVMLDNPQHTFQVLTKRSESTYTWVERFYDARHSEKFARFRDTVKSARVRAALERGWSSPWGANIWQGVSVEDSRVLKRIEDLKLCDAQTRFISAEPLLGAWGDVDLTGIHWVIVGGESGVHMKDHPHRWMQMEWAREIRDLCVAQDVAFFFKQDSAARTEARPYLVEADGSKWTWAQYPHELKPAVNVETGELWRVPNYDDATDYDFPWGDYAPPLRPTRVVSFRDVLRCWDKEHGVWRDDQYVYIGRRNPHHELPESPFANPFMISETMSRAESIKRYRAYITERMKAEPWLRDELESLRGKTLVCWCHPQACHGDVLVELLGETPPALTSEEIDLLADAERNRSGTCVSSRIAVARSLERRGLLRWVQSAQSEIMGSVGDIYAITDEGLKALPAEQTVQLALL